MASGALFPVSCTYRPDSFLILWWKKSDIGNKENELPSESDMIDVKKLVWKVVTIFPPRLLIVHERKKVYRFFFVSISFMEPGKVFSLKPCYVLLRFYSTCVITFADDKLAICNLCWLTIIWFVITVFHEYLF